jgi:hypothetical protein
MLHLLTNTISAEELFGATSRLVVGGETSLLGDIASLGMLYQLVVALIAVLYLGTVVKFFDAILFVLHSLVSKNVRRGDNATYISAIYNVERLMTIIGTALIALCVMRLSIVPEGRFLLAPLYSHSVWKSFGITFGMVILLIVCEVSAIYGIRAFVGKSSVWDELLQIKQLHFSATVALIAPFVVVILLSQGMAATIFVGVVAIVCAISLIIFVKETFLLFISHKFSILHWILYLCTLELFPLSLLLAPIFREGA